MDAESNGDVELTMQDVLEEEQELEEDAKAVLGDCDDKNCTYNDGYLPRQALYSCVTCSSGSDPGGICLACSYACHEGHELFELYTKRNFRCDCGNKKFGNNRCRLYQDKDSENAENKYNQNFRGKYCTCSRPYPDLDDDTPDAMIQCIICEDWYHGRHLGAHVPDNDDFGEMICSSCMEAHSFIYAYTNCFPPCYKTVRHSAENGVTEKESSEVSGPAENGETKEKMSEVSRPAGSAEIKKESSEVLGPAEIKKEANKGSGPSETEKELNDVFGPARNGDIKIESSEALGLNAPSQDTIEGDVNVDMFKADSSVKTECNNSEINCIYSKLGNFKPENSTGPVFWPEGWRKVLCKCPLCHERYKREQCLFLLDEGDTIHAYEERGKRRSGSESQYDKGWSALSSLDRVKQIEAVREYKIMESKLKDYLKQFADNKQTVSKRDITDFFDNITSQKRQKVGNYVQTFCR